MARPKKWVTEEEQKQARTARSIRWRKAHPHRYREAQRAAYEKRKLGKTCTEKGGLTPTVIHENTPYKPKVDLSQVKETHLADMDETEGDLEVIRRSRELYAKRSGRSMPNGERTGIEAGGISEGAGKYGDSGGRVAQCEAGIEDAGVVAPRGSETARRERFEALKGDLGIRLGIEVEWRDL